MGECHSKPSIRSNLSSIESMANDENDENGNENRTKSAPEDNFLESFSLCWNKLKEIENIDQKNFETLLTNISNEIQNVKSNLNFNDFNEKLSFLSDLSERVFNNKLTAADLYNLGETKTNKNNSTDAQRSDLTSTSRLARRGTVRIRRQTIRQGRSSSITNHLEPKVRLAKSDRVNLKEDKEPNVRNSAVIERLPSSSAESINLEFTEIPAPPAYPLQLCSEPFNFSSEGLFKLDTSHLATMHSKLDEDIESGSKCLKKNFKRIIEFKNFKTQTDDDTYTILNAIDDNLNDESGVQIDSGRDDVRQSSNGRVQKIRLSKIYQPEPNFNDLKNKILGKSTRKPVKIIQEDLDSKTGLENFFNEKIKKKYELGQVHHLTTQTLLREKKNYFLDDSITELSVYDYMKDLSDNFTNDKIWTGEDKSAKFRKNFECVGRLIRKFNKDTAKIDFLIETQKHKNKRQEIVDLIDKTRIKTNLPEDKYHEYIPPDIVFYYHFHKVKDVRLSIEVLDFLETFDKYTSDVQYLPKYSEIIQSILDSESLKVFTIDLNGV